MRKSLWIVTAVFAFLVINVQAETLSSCTKKCKGSNKAACVQCCKDQDSEARNQCAFGELKKLQKCKQAAAGDATKEAACDAAWNAANKKCWDAKRKVSIKGGCTTAGVQH